ncbi:MAG: hypothetical protein ACYC4U_20115 [Pirellulaceae bacterium]
MLTYRKEKYRSQGTTLHVARCRRMPPTASDENGRHPFDLPATCPRPARDLPVTCP